MISLRLLSIYAAALVSGANAHALPNPNSDVASRDLLEARTTITATAHMSITNDWPSNIHVAVTDNHRMSDTFPGSSSIPAFGATSVVTIKESWVPLQSTFKVQFDSLSNKAVLDVGIGQLQDRTYVRYSSGAPGQTGAMQAPGEPFSKDVTWNFFFYSGPGIVSPLVNSLVGANMAAIQAYVAKNPAKPKLVDSVALEIDSIPNNIICTYAAMKPSGNDKQYAINAIMNINGRVGGKLTMNHLGTQGFTVDLTNLNVLVQATLDLSNLASPKISITKLQFSLQKLGLSASATKAVEIIFPLIAKVLQAPTLIAGYINTKYNGNFINLANSAMSGVLPKLAKRDWFGSWFDSFPRGQSGVSPVEGGEIPSNLPPPPACIPDAAKGITCRGQLPKQEHLKRNVLNTWFRLPGFPGSDSGPTTPVQGGQGPSNPSPPPPCVPDPARGVGCQQTGHIPTTHTKRFYPGRYRLEEKLDFNAGLKAGILGHLVRRWYPRRFPQASGNPTGLPGFVNHVNPVLNLDQNLNIKLNKRAAGPYTTWMSTPAIQSKQMKDLKFPGTHDSATYALTTELSLIKYGDIAFLWDFDYQNPATADGSFPMKTPYHLGPVFGQYVLDRINHIARAQDQSIKDQLYGSIRYFDLRMYYDPASKSFFSQHGLKGANAEDILGQVASFMSEQASGSELVMLGVSHTNFGDYPECIPMFQSLVEKYLAGFVYMPPSSVGVKNFDFQSLKDMRLSDITRGKNKVMVMNTDNSSKWYFPDKIVNTAGFGESQAGKPGLYAVSNVHTPVPDDVLNNILKAVSGQVEWLLQTLALQTNAALPTFLSQQTGGYNLVFADWYEHVPQGSKAPVELVVEMN